MFFVLFIVMPSSKRPKSFEKLDANPYANEYKEMFAKGFTGKDVYDRYLSELPPGEKGVSYPTFLRWLKYSVGLQRPSSDLMEVAMRAIEKDKEILEVMDENLAILKSLIALLSETVQNIDPEKGVPSKTSRVLVDLMRESRQTAQAIIELRKKMKVADLVSPQIVRNVIIEAVATLPEPHRSRFLMRLDELIQKIAVMKTWEETEGDEDEDES